MSLAPLSCPLKNVPCLCNNVLDATSAPSAFRNTHPGMFPFPAPSISLIVLSDFPHIFAIAIRIVVVCSIVRISLRVTRPVPKTLAVAAAKLVNELTLRALISSNSLTFLGMFFACTPTANS